MYSGSEGLYEEIVIPTANQIKSATSNTSDFSTTNNDIRYSSINEDTPVNIASNVPNVSSFSQRLSVAEQTEFDDLVASALFMTSCR